MAYDTSKLTKLAALKALAQKVQSSYALQKDLAALSERVDGLVTAGGEPNKLEGIKINGTLLTLADKIADILIKESTVNGNISVNNVDVPIHGLAALAYITEAINALSIGDYAKTTEVTAAITTALADYAKTSDVNASLAKKADKVAKATNGHFAGLDADGNPTDSGKAPGDFVAAEAGKRLMTDAEGAKLGDIAEGATKVEASKTNGNVMINGTEVTVYTEPTDVVHGAIATDTEVTEMLNEVFGTTT